jgi:hypothetical protein
VEDQESWISVSVAFWEGLQQGLDRMDSYSSGMQFGIEFVQKETNILDH